MKYSDEVVACVEFRIKMMKDSLEDCKRNDEMRGLHNDYSEIEGIIKEHEDFVKEQQGEN